MALSISKLIYGFMGKGIDLVVDKFTRPPQVESHEELLERQIKTIDAAMATTPTPGGFTTPSYRASAHKGPQHRADYRLPEEGDRQGGKDSVE